MSEEQNEQKSASEEVKHVYSNTSFQLNIISGEMTTQFSFSSEPRRFVRDLNNLMLTLPSLRERLEPSEIVEGLIPTTKISAAEGPTYQATPQDVLILADATLGALQVNLIQAFNLGKRVTVIKTDSSGNAVTVAALSGDTIEGSSSVSLTAQYKKTILTADGSNVWLEEKSSELV